MHQILFHSDCELFALVTGYTSFCSSSLIVLKFQNAKLLQQRGKGLASGRQVVALGGHGEQCVPAHGHCIHEEHLVVHRHELEVNRLCHNPYFFIQKKDGPVGRADVVEGLLWREVLEELEEGHCEEHERWSEDNAIEEKLRQGLRPPLKAHAAHGSL